MKLIEAIKFWLLGRHWIAEPHYWKDKKGYFCTKCDGYIDWLKMGDLDIHDMQHWT